MAPLLMSGDPAALQRLFLRAIGDPRYVPDDFEDSWAAAYGMHIEPLALDWHAQKTGVALVDRGVQLFHPTRPFVSCTLDARRPSDNTVIDCKAINAFRDLDDAVAYYTPQAVVQLECAHAAKAALLIVKGGGEPQELPVFIADDYRMLVWKTIDAFWECIETLTPPVPLNFPRIVAPEEFTRIDLDGDDYGQLPNWAPEMRALLESFGETQATAKEHEEIKAAIKKLFPDDCGRLHYAGFAITRAKNNAVTIRHKGQ